MTIPMEDQKGIILIIDDNITNIKVIVKYLKMHNFITIIARNGETGLERARFSQPDLILLDVLMPGMDGFETCRRLKADESTKDIPVLFMTVLSETSDKLKGFVVGGVDYVTKPIREEEVLARVTTHIKLRNLQKRLEADNARLRFQSMLMDQIEDVIVSTDIEGRIIYMNQAATRSLKDNQNELIGKTVHALGEDPARGATQSEIIEKTLSDGKWRGKVVNYTKDGSEIIFDARTWLIEDKEGRDTGMVCIATDITNREYMQKTLQKTAEAAEAANRAKSVFLTNMSHELRTPMNAILGFSQLIAGDMDLAPKNQEHIAIIRRSGEHLLNLINNMLNMSKIESGKTTLNEKNFDLKHMLRELETMLGFQADRKSLFLVFVCLPDTPRHIRADETKLRQILINLIDNAIKFTEKGGVTVKVRSEQFKVKNEQREPIHPSSLITLNFEVKDTGPGIMPEEKDLLFEAFTQTETGRHAPEGTGLGLPISLKFVQLMGGNIEVHSEFGKGSTFVFDIRVHAADGANIETASCLPPVISIKPDQFRQKNNLTDIPDDLMDNLKQSAINTDMVKVDGIIKEIRKINPDLADILAALAAEFDYGKIIDMIGERNEFNR